jgi:hypothetical protein
MYPMLVNPKHSVNYKLDFTSLVLFLKNELTSQLLLKIFTSTLNMQRLKIKIILRG